MNKITVTPTGSIELETFGYKPTAPNGGLLPGDEDAFRFWAVEIQDPTTAQVMFQYNFTRMYGWDHSVRARKEELALAANPVAQVEIDGHIIRYAYLGRVEITCQSAYDRLRGDGDTPTIYTYTRHLKPAPILNLDWDTYRDGEEMLDLATAAQIDQRLLLAAALGCAGLCRHLVDKTPSATQALKSVQRCLQGKESEQLMQIALQTNDSFAAAHVDAKSALANAVRAASCRPENVVFYVLRALVYERYNHLLDLRDPYPRVSFQYLRHCYAPEVLADCAKIIRRHVKLAKHPQLQKLVAQRNVDYAKQMVVGSPHTLARNPSLAWCYPDLDRKTLSQALRLNPDLRLFLSPHQTARLL